MESVKKTMGRLKVEMVKMEKESNLQVTFSKRRAGLFKKASELCTLCGAEAAIVVFSPGNKAFSFGHPSVDEVVDHFFAQDPNYNPNFDQLVTAHQGPTVDELNTQISHLNHQLENERKHTRMLDGIKMGRQGEFWWESPVEEIATNQLLELLYGLEALKEKVSMHLNSLPMEAASLSVKNGINVVEGINNPVMNHASGLGLGDY